MKSMACLLLAFTLLLCGCSQNDSPENSAIFALKETGNLVSVSGVEYAYVAKEGELYYLGELEFVGGVKGEEASSQHMGLSYQTGMFAIKHDGSDHILVRRAPNSEWHSIYRQASLPRLDFLPENCIRLECVSGVEDVKADAIHTTCKGGITDAAEIRTFLSEVRAQKSPQDAGLYDLVKKPDGALENCYVYGVVYGFFEEEPNLAVQMRITSYNDLAYSIAIGENEYVLPEAWMQKLATAHCNH